MAFKVPFYLQNTKDWKDGSEFYRLRAHSEISTQKKKFTDIKYNTHQVGGKSESYFPQLHLLP